MERPKGDRLLTQVANTLNLPADLLAGLPRVELVGNQEVRMENHRGILAYTDREIHISGGSLIVQIKGEGLELRAMNANELLIGGSISAVALVR